MDGLISIIVTTYDRPDALDAVLRGLSRQTDRAFEVIIADDGSGPATARLIESWQPHLGARLAHVWHEHRDFRAPEIANHAVLASRGEYCIFTDGDCIPRPDFVAAHRRLAEPGWFVFGNRVLLSPELTESVLRHGLEPERWGLVPFVRRRVSGEINRLAPLFSLPLGPLRKRNSQQWESVRTCNLGVWRSDLERVDGQDGSYCGWGPHDSDLAVRLIRSGVRRKDGRFATGVLHLWHPALPRSRLAENQQRFQEVMASDRIRAVRGLSAIRPARDEAASVGAQGAPSVREAGHG